MTPVTRPQGPLPARVYWVRRALVLVTAFLLVFGFARLLGGGSDGDSDPADTAVGVSGETTESSAPSDASEAADEKGAEARKKKRKARPKRTPLAQPDGPCDPADLTVEADLRKVEASRSIEIPLVITGTADACTWQVSNESLALKITSGSDMIWSSQQCQTIEEEDVIVRSAKPASVTFEWNGHRSDEECSRLTDWADPGSYHVVAAPFGGEPSDTQFELTKPGPVKIYKTVKPKADKSEDGSGSGEDESGEDGARPSAPKTRPTTDPTHEPSGAVEPNG